MSLASYILRRVLLIVPTLFGVSLLTFALSRIVPGDPARLAAGAQATPEMYEQIQAGVRARSIRCRFSTGTT